MSADAAQVTQALAQLVSARVARLSEVLSAVEQHEGLSRHGLSQAPVTLMYSNLLALIKARLGSGPVSLKCLDMETIMLDVWRTYYRALAGSRSPITQVQCPAPIS